MVVDDKAENDLEGALPYNYLTLEHRGAQVWDQ